MGGNTCHNSYNKGSQPIYSTGTNEDRATLVWRCRQPGREVRDRTTTQVDSYETKTFRGPDYRTMVRSRGISYVPKAEEVWHDQGPRMCRWAKQRDKITKQESASPTVATESVFITAVVDAHEGRTVKIVDVPGAFMHADQNDLVHVRFTGEMVDKLIEIDEEMYAPYVTWEANQEVMYVELLKALYGTIKAAEIILGEDDKSFGEGLGVHH